MKGKIVSIVSYVWLFLTRCPANSDCLLKLHIRGIQTFLPQLQISDYTIVQGPGILHNVNVSGYVTFCEINEFFVYIFFFVIDKISLRAGFGPPAIVWRPLLYILDKAARTVYRDL